MISPQHSSRKVTWDAFIDAHSFLVVGSICKYVKEELGAEDINPDCSTYNAKVGQMSNDTADTFSGNYLLQSRDKTS